MHGPTPELQIPTANLDIHRLTAATCVVLRILILLGPEIWEWCEGLRALEVGRQFHRSDLTVEEQFVGGGRSGVRVEAGGEFKLEGKLTGGRIER